MRPPIFARPLTDAGRQVLTAGLCSSDAFVVHRCQILLASARGERAPRTRLHSTQEVAERVYAYHGCPHEPHLSLPDPVLDQAS